ncbi:nuclear transport factor 2 family protein [Winogradskyella sp.]|uniref:nuclear transport factor 2 family protein n=1 Tax=Winogradskyella sp. TaxID=1883156 RepID=UPI00263027F4|nr:nuclear transport factor 2 family protein [Winogradskyella sp.]
MKLISPQFIVAVLAVFMLNNSNSQTSRGAKIETGKTWSGIAGDPDFSLSDRLAIKDVMNAYAFYWDSGDLENFLGLFTKERLKTINKEKVQKKLDYFKSNKLQRRHLMANTHFLEQNSNTAYIKQYALLASTINKKEFSPVTTVVYDVWLVKLDGIWKISKYNINLDGEIDIKPNAKE